jgi:predicted O-methyltransferase YrrM
MGERRWCQSSGGRYCVWGLDEIGNLLSVSIMEPAQAKYAKLLSERPQLHAQFGKDDLVIGKATSHALMQNALDWLIQSVQPGSRTLETGCGYSSVVFSILQAEHVAISPFAEEHDAIKQWCAANGIPTDRTRFIAKPSQEALPSLDTGELDLVLIDGDHAFPAPFIDWYYTADRLKQGGRVIVDDTHLITGTLLSEFLQMERGRWKLEAEIGKTAIFTKVVAGRVAQPKWFGAQPFCARRDRSLVRRIRRKLGRILVHPEDAIFWP